MELLVAAVIVLISVFAVVAVVRKSTEMQVNDLHRRQARAVIMRHFEETFNNDGFNTAGNHLHLIAVKCGFDTAKRLAQNFPGYKFYIPVNGLSMVYRKYIERVFNGTNTQELALRCKVTERYVRKIINEMYQSKAQLSFFDE